MGLDIRLPIGLMFSALGVMLTLFGMFSDRVIYEKSLGININFIWGLLLLAFGIVMLLLGRFGSKPGQPTGDPGSRPHNHR